MGIPRVCTCMCILTLHCLHSHLEDGVILVELAFHHSSKLSCGGPERDFDMHGGGVLPTDFRGDPIGTAFPVVGQGWGDEGLHSSGRYVCVCVRWGGTLTLSQGLPQSHLMAVHHHIPQFLLQLFTDAQAVHCMRGGGGGRQSQGKTDIQAAPPIRIQACLILLHFTDTVFFTC